VNYFDTLSHKEFRAEFYKRMREHARREEIPILSAECARFLSQLIRISRAENVLEIGTAIGYSALKMADAGASRVVSVERSQALCEKARAYVKEHGEANVEIVCADATRLDPATLKGPFDFLFIDAAKAQYGAFFDRYGEHVAKGGLIVIDNVLFQGMNLEQETNKNIRQLIRKIDRFNRDVMHRDEYDCAVHPLGDGLMVCVKKE